jgi:methylamine---glutamate N-methyltransferase subunit B
VDATVTGAATRTAAGPAIGTATGPEQPPGLRLDLAEVPLREANDALRALPDGARAELLNPAGRHNLAVGLTTACEVTIAGPAGYYCGGLGERASITVDGPAGWGVGENLMSGTVRVRGDASQSVAASAHGGLVVVEGRVSLRAGISLKGGTLAVGGDAGAFCGFMAQAGTILIGGNAGDGLGDSLYEAVIYVAGTVRSLGTDARVEDLADEDVERVKQLVEVCGFDHIDPGNVTRIASARQLYHFATHNHDAY